MTRGLKERRNNKTLKEEFDIETKKYFQSIRQRPLISVPYFGVTSHDVSNSKVALPFHCLTALWIIEEYELYRWVDVKFAKVQRKNHQEKLDPQDTANEIEVTLYVKSPCLLQAVMYAESQETHPASINLDRFQWNSNSLVILVLDKNLLICGLSSIVRFIMKYAHMKLELEPESYEENGVSGAGADLSKQLVSLLGFRGGCLQACAEVSVWTKFCEVDVFEELDTTTKPSNSPSYLPVSLLRFEYHLRKPVKLHNIKRYTKSNPEEQLKHDYGEGPFMLMSDLVLFPSIYIFFLLYGNDVFQTHFPSVTNWCQRMNQKFQICDKIRASSKAAKNFTDWLLPSVPEESLYKSDYERYNPTSRGFTRQNDVNEALESFRSANIPLQDISQVADNLKWDDIPALAHPEGGNLPEIRRERKCQQLSSMVLEVMKVEEKVKHNESSYGSAPLRIVDFCSGGGHVGILLAWLLPKCQVILVENKEESLRRGGDRVERLGLTNVLLYQCNLDYFDDDQFHIGVALHCCGTASDLVLKKCLQANASFVISPCCYGGIKSNHILHYPRSTSFVGSGISLKQYFTLAHASDQTHDEKNEKTEQGKLCMQVIDTDRCLYAKENGYQVYLTKMVPETASPKNHIIVGISSLPAFSQCE